MNLKALVKLSNIVGGVAILLLIYWIFVFASVEIFGLKVFRENISETFFMSILGILALMAGALIINVMYNLSRIAERHNKDELLEAKAVSRKMVYLFLLSFPLIFGLLYGGDYLTSQKKKKLLIQSAESIINDHSTKAKKLLQYDFNEAWMTEASDILHLMSKTDKHFPHVSVIVKDTLDGSDIFLGFRKYYQKTYDTIPPHKKDYIIDTTQPERDYMNHFFEEGKAETRFSAYNGKYELYYPFFDDQKKIILYFSDYQRYGKIGS